MNKFLSVYPTSVNGKEYRFGSTHDMYINLSNVEMISTEELCSLETGYFEITMILNSGRVYVLQYDNGYKKGVDYNRIIDAMGL